MKKLHKYAIIPKDLYVKREADFNLARIINQKLKPGYISVSRQMGKSNLLLNAKAELENIENLFLYLDLSNPPYTSRECFQNIIDTLWETNEELLNEPYKEIVQKRRMISLTPSKEHENELKTILKYFKGNITIILDEVDALAKINYSDEIFGQIRSIYFIRKTFPSFERVTYILSGVIDPSRLIKNKDNSPFNIADKIFLGDFDFDQFETFLSLANLKLTSEIKERVFYWLQGNPRMTYDICSEIEDRVLASQTITLNLIDEIIKKTYLNKFDTPPIDHIRDLVQQNSELRNSITLINFNQSSKLNDEIIGKLYLAGIINNENKDNIKIKNEVIKQSLNPEWIEQIELSQKGLFRVGQEKFLNRDYEGAIVTLEEFLSANPSASKDTIRFANFHLGEIYNKLGQYEKSSNYLNKVNFEKDSNQKEYHRAYFILGMNELGAGRSIESQIFFDIIINDSPNNDTYLNALLNKGVALSSEYTEEKIKESDQLFNKVINDADNLSEISSPNSFKSLAYFQKGNNALKLKDNIVASQLFELSFGISEAQYKPAILNHLYLSELDQEKRNKYLFQIFNYIKEEKIKLDKTSNNSLSFNENLLILILFEIAESKLENLFQEFTEYAEIELLKENIQNIIFDVSMLAINLSRQDIASNLLLKIINNKTDTITYLEQRANLYMHFLSIDPSLRLKYFRDYCAIFKEKNNFNLKIDNLDLNAFINIIGFLREELDHDIIDLNIEESFSYCKTIEPYLENIPQDLVVDSIVIYFFISDYFNFKNRAYEAIDYVDIMLNKISTCYENISEFSNAKIKSLKILEKNAKRIKNKFKNTISLPSVPYKNEIRYGRNDMVTVQYHNGSIETGKFKKYISEIERGLCYIINTI